MLVGVSDNDKCVSVTSCKCVYVSVCVCVCVSFLGLSVKWRSGCLFNLFSPHHVNQGGVQNVQNPTPEVTLYEPHTAEVVMSQRWENEYYFK
jgi:hypothetical protein